MREIRLSGLMQGREPVGGLSVYRLLPTLPNPGTFSGCEGCDLKETPTNPPSALQMKVCAY